MDLLQEYGIDELSHMNVNHLGLNKKDWIKSRGARETQSYKDDSDNTVVKEWYDYTYINGGRTISAYTRHMEWLDTEGNAILTKVTTPDLSGSHLKDVNRGVRQGRIDYLETAAENLRDLAATLPEPYKTQYNTIADSIDVLFDHYETQVNSYIQRGTLAFETAVENETDPSILGILAIPSRAPDVIFPNGLTVKQSIIYQLTGVKP